MSHATVQRVFSEAALLFLVVSAMGDRVAAQDRLQQLDDRIARVESQLRGLLAEVQDLRKLRAQLDAEPSLAETDVDLGNRGLQVEKPKEEYAFRVGGGVQVDGRTFFAGRTLIGGDTILIRRARPALDLTAGQFGFRLTPDFGGAVPALVDAYMTWTITPGLQLLAGKMKPPVGLERLQPAATLGLAERGLPTELVPNRDLGLMVKASAFDQRLDLNLGLFDGAPDGSSLVQDFDNKKDVVARIFTHPFPEGSAGQGLGFGLAGSYGKHLGLARIYQTTTLQPFFKFAPNTLSDGISWRVAPQGYYYRGPFGLMAEYVTSSQEMALAQKRMRARNSAWQIMGNFVLTGEDASYRGVRPASDFEPGAGKFGALEFVMRAGRLSFDEEIFPEFADERLSARRATGFGAGLNWYLSRQVKFVFDYETTGFLPFTEPVAREHALITRMQFAYW